MTTYKVLTFGGQVATFFSSSLPGVSNERYRYSVMHFGLKVTSSNHVTKKQSLVNPFVSFVSLRTYTDFRAFISQATFIAKNPDITIEVLYSACIYREGTQGSKCTSQINNYHISSLRGENRVAILTHNIN